MKLSENVEIVNFKDLHGSRGDRVVLTPCQKFKFY